MRVARASGHVYYYCRRDLVTSCGSPMVREDALLPWAESLFEALDAMRGADFEEAMARAEDRRQSPDAVAQVDGKLDRLTQLFQWGDITRERYEAERERLTGLRDELLVTSAPQPTIHVDGMLDGWRRGTADERRLLLGVFFDALHVKDGRIVAFSLVWRGGQTESAVIIVDDMFTFGRVSGAVAEHLRSRGAVHTVVACLAATRR